MSNRAVLVFALAVCLVGLIAANFLCAAIGISTRETAIDRSVFQFVAYVAFFVAEYTQPILFERED